MRLAKHFKYAVLLTALLLNASAQSANQTSNNLDVGLHYLETLYTTDYEELGTLLHEEAIFEDPTSLAFAGEYWLAEGRSTIVDFFRQANEGVIDGGFDVQSSFTSDEYIVFTLEYWSKFKGELLEIPGMTLSIRIPAVTILQIQDGLITHHTDYADYVVLHEQVAQQTK